MKQWTGLIVVLMLVVAGCKAPRPTETTPDSGVTNIHDPKLVAPTDGNTEGLPPAPETDEDTETTP